MSIKYNYEMQGFNVIYKWIGMNLYNFKINVINFERLFKD